MGPQKYYIGSVFVENIDGIRMEDGSVVTFDDEVEK